MKEVFDKLISRLEELFCGEYNTEYIKKDEVLKIVNQVAEEYNNGWISCSERLPDSGQSVIVSYKDRFLTQADGTCEGWYDAPNMRWLLSDYECSDNAEVIAWSPLPAPYKKEGDK